MTFAKFDVNEDTVEPLKSRKYPYYWSPVYCASWFILFYAAVVPSYNYYPQTLLRYEEDRYHDRFIGERCQHQLLKLVSIGIKLAGTQENIITRNFLLQEIDKIKNATRSDLYDIDVEVQYASGNFMLWNMSNYYHNVTNVIVKIGAKNTFSQTYLLLNSHYDSEVGSPGAADDGVMVAIMLETLRVISRSEKPLKNPIVFLFNGAEESNLLASHGFITRHRWAPNCKALINLDSAGAGGREVVFQSGPDHPWLMRHYKESVPHPFATTAAEELFQNNFIPSDTDFRIFRDYRGVPGLDMAHSQNGYFYHTKYDNFANVKYGTCQTTGDNILALAWALANADELQNTEAYAEGHTIFFDFLGWFMISYQESTGIAINIVTSVGAIITIGVSLYIMTKSKSSDSSKRVYLRFLVILLIQIITLLTAVGAVLLIGIILGALGLSESWYSGVWITFGLYFSPIFFILGMIPALYIHLTRDKTNMQLNDTIACFMHAHCIILAIICILMTCWSIRSAYIPMIAVFFYTCSVITNMLAERWCKRCYFVPITLVFQLLPYWFYTYLMYGFFVIFIPMQGRDGPYSKPETLVSIFCAVLSFHFAGFILPVLHKFRKSKTYFSIFGIFTIAFIIIAATPAGFPYKADITPQRFYVLHTNRIFHAYDGSITKSESGYYVQPADTRPQTLDDSIFRNALPQSWIKDECATELFCGLPLYSTRWMTWKSAARWIPANPPQLAVPLELTLRGKEHLSETKVRYSFSLQAPDRVVIFINPYTNTNITSWTFDRTPLDENYKPPYFISLHYYQADGTPFSFHIEIEYDSPTYDGPSIKLAIGAHYLHHTDFYTEEYREFLKSFPAWVYPTNWVSAFESWIF